MTKEEDEARLPKLERAEIDEAIQKNRPKETALNTSGVFGYSLCKEVNVFKLSTSSIFAWRRKALILQDCSACRFGRGVLDGV